MGTLDERRSRPNPPVACHDELRSRRDQDESCRYAVQAPIHQGQRERRAVADHDDTSRIANLETQIDRKAACIAVQTANLTELRRILALERANFARSTSGSAWAKENAAAYKAIGLAIDYLYKAYTSAAAGSYGTANVWLSRSNAQVSVSNKQVKLANAEIKKINTASDAINKANDLFGETLDKTASTCGS